MYGAIGFGCGIIGQGLANLIMISKRLYLFHEFCSRTFRLQRWLLLFLFLCDPYPFLLAYIRSIKKSEDEVPVPPLLKSAALWGTSRLFILFQFYLIDFPWVM